MESFGTGLKRISDLCNKANCKYGFEKQKNGFVVKFFRNNLMGTIQDTIQDTSQVKSREIALLNYCRTPKTRKEMQDFVGIKNRPYFSEHVLKPLLISNKLSMTISDKPNSKKQKYISK